MASIVVNGKSQSTEGAITLLELLKQNAVEQPEMVSIQVNGAFVGREAYETTILNDQDEVDFLYFMGGGSRC